ISRGGTLAPEKWSPGRFEACAARGNGLIIRLAMDPAESPSATPSLTRRRRTFLAAAPGERRGCGRRFGGVHGEADDKPIPSSRAGLKTPGTPFLRRQSAAA